MSLWPRRHILGLGGLMALGACDRARPDSAPRPFAPRIASQVVLSDEVLWDLGTAVQANVVAVSSLADDPQYSQVARQWPTTIPRIAGTSEAILALAPTLVILASFTAPPTRRLIEGAGLDMLLLERFEGFDDYRTNVRTIARAVKAVEAGERLITEFDARLAQLRIDAPRSERVVSWSDGNVPASGTTFDDIARASGLQNLPAQLGRRGHLHIGLEQLVAWDPDIIVVPCAPGRCPQLARHIAQQPGLRATRAARHNRVVGIPSSALYSTGRGMLDAVERLGSMSRTESPR